MHYGIWKRSWGDEGQQSGSRAGIGTGQTGTLHTAAVASFRQFQLGQQPGLTPNKPQSDMDDNNPTNTIASRQSQTDITQLTAEPTTQ